MARGGRPYRGGKFRGNGGRGRGGGGGSSGGGGGFPGSNYMQDELDFTVQQFADVRPETPRGRGRGRGRGNQTPRGGARGRGRGGPYTPGGQNSNPGSGTNTPFRGRGRGIDSPRGRIHEGIGSSPRGRGSGPIRQNATLSGLLYQERPLLRPIVFVPSLLTKILFQDEEDEELLKPVVEDVDETEQSHVPTADRVSRVFSGGNVPQLSGDDEADDSTQEEIEEVDFNNLDAIFNSSSAIAATTTTTIRKSKLSESTTIAEEQFTGFYVDKTPLPPPPLTSVNDLATMVEETLSTNEDITMHETNASASTDALFFVDTQPTAVPSNLAPSSGFQPPAALQADDDDDDVIVYVAPHPRNVSRDEQEPIHEEESSNVGGPPDTSRFSPYVRAAPLPAPEVSEAAATQEDASGAVVGGPPPRDPAQLPTISSMSFSFSQSTSTPEAGPSASGGTSTPRLRVPPVTTPRQAKVWKEKLGRAGKKKASKARVASKPKGKSSFGAFGAMREEMLLEKDERFDERRRGDSDLEWGDTDSGAEEVKAEDAPGDDIGVGMDPELTRVFGMLANPNGMDKGKGKAKADDHGMQVDEDLDMSAMKSFVGSLLGRDAGRHVTMDDMRDEEIMRIEDEEDAIGVDRGSSGDESDEDPEVEEVLRVEEAMLISETLNVEGMSDDDDEDEDEDEDEDDDDDQTPISSFQARLERLRARARSRKPEDASFDDYMEDDDGDDGDEDEDLGKTWAEQDDDFIRQMQDMLDENEDILTGRNRRQRNKLFKSIRNGDFDDMEGFASPSKRKKDKMKDLPPEVQEQWEKDRLKKAENKKARQLARLVAAADPLSKKKGGKKGIKAMLAASSASLDPTIIILPNRIIDMTTLVQQIRRFIDDVGGPNTMSLPPTNKETRKNVHEMAIAFGLKSVSKGKGDARYTTLSKTSRSGMRVDERKVAKIVRRAGGPGARGEDFVGYEGRKGRGGDVRMPRHKEGDEVGKAAPKIGESNVGFKLLAMMGWTEGERIGSSMKGLDAPLTAIIKTTKLGLGATR